MKEVRCAQRFGAGRTGALLVGDMWRWAMRRETADEQELEKMWRQTMRWLVAGLDQLDQTQRRVLRLMHRTVLEQVADLILDEADDRGEVHLSQAAMATLLSASRQSVNEALNELRRRGQVETGYLLVRVLDAAGLSQIAGRD